MAKKQKTPASPVTAVPTVGPSPPAPPFVPPPPPPVPSAPAVAPTQPLVLDQPFFEAAPKLNVKQSAKKASKAKESALKMRAHLWPEAKDANLWIRDDETRKGFTTIPRTMPIFINLIQDVSKHVSGGKSIPAGRSYLVLWGRVWDEGFVKIEQEAAAALEAGYAGERNVTTWREHLRVLHALGFIDTKAGPSGPFQYVLLWNPYHAVKALKAKGWVQEAAYTALYQRAIDIGATDLDEA